MSTFEINDEQIARLIADDLKASITDQVVEHLVCNSLVGVDAACQYLGTGRTTLWELVNRGAIRSIKIGRSPKFRLKWLDEYVDAQ